MNAKSVKRALGLAAAAVSSTGAMMLVPTMANAATAHTQAAGNVSKTSGWGWGDEGNNECGCEAWGWGWGQDRNKEFEGWGWGQDRNKEFVAWGWGFGQDNKF
jgi:hypothetical protein